MMIFKEKVHQHFLQLINEKIMHLQQVLTGLKESAANETKSTAGDKHETALAMLQIEQANVRRQLQDVQEQKAVLEKINAAVVPAAVVNGSFINTNKGCFFMSVALGKTTVEGTVVTALSNQSPLGSKLWHLQVGDKAIVNKNEFIIESIL